MLKELRRSSPTPAWRPEATSIVPDQDAATRTSPLCYVVDDEPGIRNMISYALQTDGITTREFQSAACAFGRSRRMRARSHSLDLSLEGSDAVDAIRGLDLLGYCGTVQLISGRDEALLNDIKNIGQRRSLRMLPVLAKPFRLDAIRQVVKDLDIAGRSSAPQSVRRDADQAALLDLDPGAQGAPDRSISLAEALANDWVEFWYAHRSSTSRATAWPPPSCWPVSGIRNTASSARRRSCRARTWTRCARSPSERSSTACVIGRHLPRSVSD